MLRLSETQHELNVVNDQFGSPTATADLAPLLVRMLESEKYGLYHVTNEGFCNWFEFAKAIFSTFDIDITVNPVDGLSFPTKAKRPKNSRMSKEKLVKAGFSPLPTWQKTLENWRIEYEKLEET
jgi:dTDP-4-dehydrorhamnose reductase